MSGHDIALICGNSNPKLAASIAKRLRIPLVKTVVSTFANGETNVQIDESVREKDVFIIQPTALNPNDTLIELLIMADAVRRASACRITAVVPCLGYSRQDKKEKSRAPISAKLIANMIEVAGIHRVLTIDLHSSQMQGFFNIPVDNLKTEKYEEQYIQRNIPEEKVIVAPGVSAVLRAKELADDLELPLVIIHFGKLYPGGVKDEVGINAKEMKVVGDVKGKGAILVSDMADTCALESKMSEALLTNGATKVYAVATHGILSDSAVENINTSFFTEFITTNTCSLEDKQKLCPKLKVIDVAGLIADAIRRIHYGESLSFLFERETTL